MSHRALIAAALADGLSTLTGLLDSRDIRCTRGCLASMGAFFKDAPDGSVKVAGVSGKPRGGSESMPAPLFVEESGTTCRLITAIAAAGQGVFSLFGSGRMHDRPIMELARALDIQKARFRFTGKSGYPPFMLKAQGFPGGPIPITLEESSQYLSGLLLAAPMAASRTVVGVAGSKAVSWPYVALTLQVMGDFGVGVTVQTLDGQGENSGWADADWRNLKEVRPGATRFLIDPAQYQPRDYVVEGDWSNASYFLAAGAMGPRPVTVRGLRRDSLQGDRYILDILDFMRAKVSWDGDAVTVAPGPLRGVYVDMGACPDLVPTVAVLAAFADSPTTIRGAAHLRIKECDRIAAPAEELAKAGIGSEILPDGLRIVPGPLPSGQTIAFSAHNDHRMAMSLSLLSLAGIGVTLDDPACVAKSFPDFHERFAPVREGQRP
jgi:3-phosphoshikimate 1-carboxyvinyltransferase